MNRINRIKRFCSEYEGELIELRRWFHQYPETSYKEYRTSEKITSFLSDCEISDVVHVAQTGVIATLGTKGKSIACRFNMDGLPIQENTGLSFTSLIDNCSHACGHDFELAWGLMIAKYYSIYPPRQTLKLIFQPAEEGPGEEENCWTGGQKLAEEGYFNVDGIFSFHVEPKLPVGTISITDGEVTCAAYDFEVTITGKMCHAAKPEEGKNPIYFANIFLNQLDKLQSETLEKVKNKDGFALISVTDIRSAHSRFGAIEDNINTIPEIVMLRGITRLRSTLAQESAIEGLESISSMLNQQTEGCKLNLIKRAPATLNDKQLVGIAQEVVRLLGYQLNEQRTTWRDDAGWASEKAPSAHGFVGVRNGNVGSLHSPFFNPSEKGLKNGLQVYISILDKVCNS